MTHIHLLKVCLGSCWDSVQASLIFIHFPIPNEENVTKKVRILDVSCRCFMMGAETWDFGDFIHWGIQECSYSGCSYFSFPSISITFQPEDIKDWTSLEVSWSYESLRVRVFFRETQFRVAAGLAEVVYNATSNELVRPWDSQDHAGLIYVEPCWDIYIDSIMFVVI